MKITDENNLTHQLLIQYFISTHAPSSPKLPKKGSKIVQWTQRLKKKDTEVFPFFVSNNFNEG